MDTACDLAGGGALTSIVILSTAVSPSHVVSASAAAAAFASRTTDMAVTKVSYYGAV